MMEIHRKKHPFKKNITKYIFTKDKNNCLCVEHDLDCDYGEHSTSFTALKVEIDYNNCYKKECLEKITLADVPKRVTDILTYLS